jgi:transcriptional regulator with XRE-family HTH domain
LDVKNFDLAWARKEADLTQKETAEALGVDVDTVGRWERGARNMPKRHWQNFVKLTGVDGRGVAPYQGRQAEPREQSDRSTRRVREYDEKGYPVGFDPQRYKDIAEDIGAGIDDFDDLIGQDMATATLLEIEGMDFEARNLKRAQIESVARGGFALNLHELPSDIEACKDAIYYWEQWKVSGCKNRQAISSAREAYRRWLAGEDAAVIARKKLAAENCKLQSFTRSDS